MYGRYRAGSEVGRSCISPISPLHLAHISEAGRCYGQFNNQLALLVHALAVAAAMGRVLTLLWLGLGLGLARSF